MRDCKVENATVGNSVAVFQKERTNFFHFSRMRASGCGRVVCVCVCVCNAFSAWVVPERQGQ